MLSAKNLQETALLSFLFSLDRQRRAAVICIEKSHRLAIYVTPSIAHCLRDAVETNALIEQIRAVLTAISRDNEKSKGTLLTFTS